LHFFTISQKARPLFPLSGAFRTWCDFHPRRFFSRRKPGNARAICGRLLPFRARRRLLIPLLSRGRWLLSQRDHSFHLATCFGKDVRFFFPPTVRAAVFSLFSCRICCPGWVAIKPGSGMSFQEATTPLVFFLLSEQPFGTPPVFLFSPPRGPLPLQC